MACKKTEKWISDDVDGTLLERKKRRLDRHLAGCASCREYRRRLEKLQSAAQVLDSPQVPALYWEESVARLRARILSGIPGDAKQTGERSRWMFLPARGWVWAGATSTLAVAAVLYLSVIRTKPPVEPYFGSFEEAVTNLYVQIGNNTELEDNFNTAVVTSIREQANIADDDVKRLMYGSSLFLESLSDEEIRALDSQIAKELKI